MLLHSWCSIREDNRLFIAVVCCDRIELNFHLVVLPLFHHICISSTEYTCPVPPRLLSLSARLRGTEGSASGNKSPRQLVGRLDVIDDTCHSSCVTPWRHEREREKVKMGMEGGGDFSKGSPSCEFLCVVVKVWRVWPVDCFWDFNLWGA